MIVSYSFVRAGLRLTKSSFNSSYTHFSSRHISLSSSRNMKFAQFVYKEHPNALRVGYVEDDKIVDINKADNSLPTTFIELLKCGGIPKVQALKKKNPPQIPLTSVIVQAPVTGMDKVLCIGLNYLDHCEEQKKTPPKEPMMFSKFASSVVGPNDPVRLRTKATQQVDFEVEMVVVIGKSTSNVTSSRAMEHVAGYSLAQDISARDWQKEKNGGQFLLGKSMDTFCPLGPYVVTADEVRDPHLLNIKCSVNGVLKQDSNTKQLIHKIPDVIERLSTVMTLLPGDIILTGTPGGVGLTRDPPEFLQPGDVITSELDAVGILQTKVEAYSD